jgi:hypothetical protein
VRTHILESDEDLANLPRMYYQPSDLVVLRMLAAKRASGSLATAR